MKLSLNIFFLFNFFFASSQEKVQLQKYDSLVGLAKLGYEKADYKIASENYSRAFITLGNRGFEEDRYKAAEAWSYLKNYDSAFVQLFKLALKTDFMDFHEINQSKAFVNIRTHEKWKELCQFLNPKQEVYNDSLAVVLSAIRRTDQVYRKQLDSIMNGFGLESNEYKTLWKTISYHDSLNLIIVREIIDAYGWLSRNQVGKQGNTTIWLVIQHADLGTQEKYFPIMQKAVDDAKASKKDLAFLQDRILMRQGKKRIYGTQYQIDKKTGKQKMWEVEDPDNLSERRKSVGL